MDESKPNNEAFWWCPQCKEEVPWHRVTPGERHEDCGNCVFSMTDTTTIDELAALRTELEKVKGERDAARTLLERLMIAERWLEEGE
jgi:hypothetical protein